MKVHEEDQPHSDVRDDGVPQHTHEGGRGST